MNAFDSAWSLSKDEPIRLQPSNTLARRAKKDLETDKNNWIDSDAYREMMERIGDLYDPQDGTISIDENIEQYMLETGKNPYRQLPGREMPNKHGGTAKVLADPFTPIHPQRFYDWQDKNASEPMDLSWRLLKDSVDSFRYAMDTDEGERGTGYAAQDIKLNTHYLGPAGELPGLTNITRGPIRTSSSVHPASQYRHLKLEIPKLNEKAVEERFWTEPHPDDPNKGSIGEGYTMDSLKEISAHETAHEILERILPDLDTMGHEFGAYTVEDAQKRRDPHDTLTALTNHPEFNPLHMSRDAIASIQEILADLVEGGLSSKEQAQTMGRRARENAKKRGGNKNDPV